MTQRLDRSTDDEADTRRFVRGLNIVIAIGVLVGIVGVILSPVNVTLRLAVAGVGALALMASEWQLRQSASRSVLVLAAGFWLLAAVNAVMFSGVHASGNVVFPFVLALLGWQLGRAWLVAATVATILFLLTLAMLEWKGWFVPTPRPPVIGAVTTMLAVIPVIAYLTYSARKSLLQSRDRAIEVFLDMHQFMENVPSAVAYFDHQWRVRDCNGRYAALYGATPEELRGKFVRDFAPDVVQDQLRETGRKVLAGELRGYRRFHVHPKTHAVTWQDAAITPHTVDGKVVGIYAALTDVTDKVQAESEIRELNSELERRVQARSQELARALEELNTSRDDLIRSQAQAGLAAMVASVSHELATPVGNSVLVASTFSDMATLLGDQLESGQMRKSSLVELQKKLADGSEMLQRNLARAEVLLRSFKQVSADQASEQRRTFDLADVVSEVVASMAPQLRRAPHQVNLDVPSGIQMDSLPGPLGQVVINLINNSYLHAFDGDIQGVVTVHAQESGTDVLLQIADDGKGMTPDVLASLFVPFFSTRIGEGGTGLGMSIVRDIVVKTLGGSIDVKSTPGQGTCYLITLPRSAPRFGD